MSQQHPTNCNACGSRNPTNATHCLRCNAPLSFAVHLANQDKITRLNPASVLAVLLIIAAIAYAFRTELSQVFANTKTKKTVCVGIWESDRLANYQSEGYQRCDILEQERCTSSTDRCLTKTFEPNSPTPQPPLDNP